MHAPRAWINGAGINRGPFHDPIYLRVWDFGVLTLLTSPAGAQEVSSYPSRPITIVVPFPAGGAADLLARMAGEAVKQSLGQSVVVENRGASGITGTEYVSRADPDGPRSSMHRCSIFPSVT
jgi:tripartite-type tricarboxylate transporter receptor subunit TctC